MQSCRQHTSLSSVARGLCSSGSWLSCDLLPAEFAASMLISDSSASVTPMLDRLLRIFTATSVSRHLPRCTLPMLPSPICFFNTCAGQRNSPEPSQRKRPFDYSCRRENCGGLYAAQRADEEARPAAHQLSERDGPGAPKGVQAGGPEVGVNAGGGTAWVQGLSVAHVGHLRKGGHGRVLPQSPDLFRLIRRSCRAEAGLSTVCSTWYILHHTSQHCTCDIDAQVMTCRREHQRCL